VKRIRTRPNVLAYTPSLYPLLGVEPDQVVATLSNFPRIALAVSEAMAKAIASLVGDLSDYERKY
jgi:hypothetical protein